MAYPFDYMSNVSVTCNIWENGCHLKTCRKEAETEINEIKPAWLFLKVPYRLMERTALNLASCLLILLPVRAAGYKAPLYPTV